MSRDVNVTRAWFSGEWRERDRHFAAGLLRAVEE